MHTLCVLVCVCVGFPLCVCLTVCVCVVIVCPSLTPAGSGGQLGYIKPAAVSASPATGLSSVCVSVGDPSGEKRTDISVGQIERETFTVSLLESRICVSINVHVFSRLVGNGILFVLKINGLSRKSRRGCNHCNGILWGNVLTHRLTQHFLTTLARCVFCRSECF